MNKLKPANEFAQAVVEHMHAFRTSLSKESGREAGRLNLAALLHLLATILTTLNRG